MRTAPGIVVVGGGARSGKSRFALSRAMQLGTRRVFLATAEALDDEMRARIARHAEERGRAFTTIEEPRRLAEAISAASADTDVILVDSPGGGSGRVFDWTLAEGAPGGIRLLLAGGLDTANVADAIRRVRPWGVDVCSGVETFAGSGHKDPRKLRQFVEIAREVGEEVETDGWAPHGPLEPYQRPYDWAVDQQS